VTVTAGGDVGVGRGPGVVAGDEAAEGIEPAVTVGLLAGDGVEASQAAPNTRRMTPHRRMHVNVRRTSWLAG